MSFLTLPIVGSRLYVEAAVAAAAAFLAFYYSLIIYSYRSLSSSTYRCFSISAFLASIGSVFIGLFILLLYAGLAAAIACCGYLTAPYIYLDFFARVPGVE